MGWGVQEEGRQLNVLRSFHLTVFNYGILFAFRKQLSTILALHYQLKPYMHLLLALGGPKVNKTLSLSMLKEGLFGLNQVQQVSILL
jgi:hypothetical protein